MRTVKYTNSIDFHCLEDLRKTPMEVNLVHMGREECKPYHVFSGIRDEYIIHFVFSGRGFYSASDNTWPLGAGQMFLIYPDAPIVYCADKEDPWSYAWIGFNGLGADTILKQCGFSKKRLVLPAPAYNDYMDCFDDFFKHIALDFSNALYRESILLRLLAILSEHYAKLTQDGNGEKTDHGSNEYVRLAMDYINEMYMHNINVADIVEHIGITRSHLNFVFQKELNITIQRYLNDFRMHKAANLLVNTALSIKEISNQVGYADQLVFSKAFKRKYGMSPKSYRSYQDELEIRKKRP